MIPCHQQGKLNVVESFWVGLKKERKMVWAGAGTWLAGVTHILIG
jgi:hypothetical protein